MLYADFYFRMKRQDAVCVAGWTQGPIGDARLIVGQQEMRATAMLTHLRGDLPPGAVGFILRFELGGEILDVERSRLVLKDPDRSAAFPSASANIDALIGSATDELFICLLMGVVEGTFAVEEPSAQAGLHRRALSMAGNRSFMELPGAAVAQDQALCFANPPRMMVSGWMGDDGKGQDVRIRGRIIDAEGLMALPVYPGVLIRPDLAGVHIRALKVGVSSGYVGVAQLERPLASEAVCLIGMIRDGQTIGALRVVQNLPAPDLGRHFENLRRNLVDADRADEILHSLLPALPDYHGGGERAERVERAAEPSGIAYLVEHDLDPWIGRDLVRLIRTNEPGLSTVTLVTEQASEALIRATLADRTEAGKGAPEIEMATANTPLATWAPAARHLVVSTAATLFQTLPFATLSKARADEIPAVCHVLCDDLEEGPVGIPQAMGIAALAAGQPFVAQLDQTLVEPVILPEALYLTHVSQMRWLMISLAGAGMVTFVGAPGRGFMSGRDPVPVQSRMIELQAMRLAAEETAN